MTLLHYRLEKCVEIVSSRVEGNLRLDWDLIPALWSLLFASKVNTGAGMSIKRCLRRAVLGEELSDKTIAEATARILQLLRHGFYRDPTGKFTKANGDVSRITQLVGLSDQEQRLLRNYHFMPSRLPGTRQLRRTINFLLFRARVVYGTPIF